MPRYGTNSYREIRGVLAPEYRDLPDESVEAIVQSSLGAVDAEALESFFGGLKKVGQTIAQAAPTVLPIVGAVAGTALGGPVGASVGGTVGRLAGGAISGAASGQRASSILKQAGGTLFSQATSLVPGLGAAGGGGSPAAAQLLGVFNRPEILQSLMAMAMGPAGSTHVPVRVGSRGAAAVSPTNVPVTAIANLIATLANRAITEHDAARPQQDESVPSYLLGEGGEFLVDPAVPEQRAQLVLELLNSSIPESDDYFDAGEFYLSDESDESDEADDYYDMLELSEAFADEY